MTATATAPVKTVEMPAEEAELRARIAKGQEKLEAARKEARDTDAIRGKLEGLCRELDEMLGHPVPAEVNFRAEPKGLHEVLRALDIGRMAHAEELRVLKLRADEGERRLVTAEGNVDATAAIKRKLNEIRSEMKRLQTAYEVPYKIVADLTTLDGLEAYVPEGSKLRLVLPGILDLAVKVDGVPF